jgi:hypothetical protein
MTVFWISELGSIILSIGISFAVSLTFFELMPPYLAGISTLIIMVVAISVMTWPRLQVRLMILRRMSKQQGYGLDVDKLRVGDIIATNRAGKLSKAIREETGGKYSHVAIYIGANQICEGAFPRARATFAAAYILTNDISTFCVLRPRQPHLIDGEKLVNLAIYYSFSLYGIAKR